MKYEISFGYFLQQMGEHPILLISVLLTLGVIFVNGWTDAPNAIATCVATRCIGVRRAIIMAAVCNFFGVLVMTMFNSKVAMTIKNMVNFNGNNQDAMIALCAAMAAIVIWAVGAWYFGIPTSESHALIAGLTGAAIALQGGMDGVNGAAMAFVHGAQDGQKFMGVLLLGLFLTNGMEDTQGAVIPIWMMILCSAVMGVGTSIGGKKIIKSVGMDMVKLEKYQGFSADVAASVSILVSTLFGLPVSTTHVKTTAIMGVGAVKRKSSINFSVVKDMLLAWVLTFPGCGVIGFGMAKLMLLLK